MAPEAGRCRRQDYPPRNILTTHTGAPLTPPDKETRMAVIVTRMPSTGAVTNVTESPGPVEVVRAAWADVECVKVYSDAEYAALPKCPTCGEWTALGRCADCR